MTSVSMCVCVCVCVCVQDSNGQTAMHWAAVTGSYRCLKLLLAKNPDIRVRDVDGR